MKNWLLAALMITMLALGACGNGASGGPTATATGTATPTPTATPVSGAVVDMGFETFVQSSVSIKAGQAVTFRDPLSTGAIHVLCLGKDEICHPNPQGPAVLNSSSGFMFQAGDHDLPVIFPNAGTFTVTCTIHPNMNVTITVS